MILLLGLVVAIFALYFLIKRYDLLQRVPAKISTPGVAPS
jgi:hypothetical protein